MEAKDKSIIINDVINKLELMLAKDIYLMEDKKALIDAITLLNKYEKEENKNILIDVILSFLKAFLIHEIFSGDSKDH